MVQSSPNHNDFVDEQQPTEPSVAGLSHAGTIPSSSIEMTTFPGFYEWICGEGQQKVRDLYDRAKRVGTSKAHGNRAKKPEESHEASGGGQEYDSGMSAEHESVGSKEDFPYGDIQGYGEVNEENGEASGDEVHDLHDEHDITASGDEEKPQSKNGTHSRGRSKGFTKYNNRGQLVWRMEKVDKWELAVLHDDIRFNLLEEADRYGKWAHKQHKDGEADGDRTAFFAPHQNHSFKRENRPAILFQYKCDGRKGPHKNPDIWRYHGYVVLSGDHCPLLDWNIPTAISSKVDGWYLELLHRENTLLTTFDILQRVPSKFWKTSRLRAAMAMRRSRFRLHTGLRAWTAKDDDAPFNRLMDEIVGDQCIQENCTRTMGRDLDTVEIDRLVNTGKGSRPERIRNDKPYKAEKVRAKKEKEQQKKPAKGKSQSTADAEESLTSDTNSEDDAFEIPAPLWAPKKKRTITSLHGAQQGSATRNTTAGYGYRSPFVGQSSRGHFRSLPHAGLYDPLTPNPSVPVQPSPFYQSSSRASRKRPAESEHLDYGGAEYKKQRVVSTPPARSSPYADSSHRVDGIGMHHNQIPAMPSYASGVKSSNQVYQGVPHGTHRAEMSPFVPHLGQHFALQDVPITGAITHPAIESSFNDSIDTFDHPENSFETSGLDDTINESFELSPGWSPPGAAGVTPQDGATPPTLIESSPLQYPTSAAALQPTPALETRHVTDDSRIETYDEPDADAETFTTHAQHEPSGINSLATPSPVDFSHVAPRTEQERLCVFAYVTQVLYEYKAIAGEDPCIKLDDNLSYYDQWTIINAKLQQGKNEGWILGNSRLNRSMGWYNGFPALSTASGI